MDQERYQELDKARSGKRQRKTKQRRKRQRKRQKKRCKEFYSGENAQR